MHHEKDIGSHTIAFLTLCHVFSNIKLLITKMLGPDIMYSVYSDASIIYNTSITTISLFENNFTQATIILSCIMEPKDKM